MLIRIALFMLLSASVPAYSYVQNIFYLMQFETDNVTNRVILAAVTNSIKEEFEKEHFYLLDGVNPGPENEQPDYLMNGFVSYQGDRYAITLRVENITNRKDKWEDSVYTTDMKSFAGFREAATALAFRAEIFRKGRTPNVYREKTDYKRLHGRDDAAKFKRKLDHIEMLNFIGASMVFPTGYDAGLPFRFRLDFFEYAYIWIIPNTAFGGGVGGKVFSYRSPTAMTFLPLEAYVPIFIFPDDYEFNRKDLYFAVEGGFFIPQYSYIDLSLRLQFNGVSVTLGWLYQPYYADAAGNPVRNESWTLYGGLTITFGKYTVKWQ